MVGYLASNVYNALTIECCWVVENFKRSLFKQKWIWPKRESKKKLKVKLK